MNAHRHHSTLARSLRRTRHNGMRRNDEIAFDPVTIPFAQGTLLAGMGEIGRPAQEAIAEIEAVSVTSGLTKEKALEILKKHYTVTNDAEATQWLSGANAFTSDDFQTFLTSYDIAPAAAIAEAQAQFDQIFTASVKKETKMKINLPWIIGGVVLTGGLYWWFTRD